MKLRLSSVVFFLILFKSANLISSRHDEIATYCFSHGDCVRYCNKLLGRGKGPACCFGDKFTGGSTCYCCPSWPDDLDSDAMTNLDACPSYIPTEDIDAPTDSSHNRVTDFTQDFCTSCIQVFISATVRRRDIFSCYADEATIFIEDD